MNEAEFREKLDTLGRHYQTFIRRINETDSPETKARHRSDASGVLDEIQALEREHGVRGAMEKAICPPSRDEVVWAKIPDGVITSVAVDGRTVHRYPHAPVTAPREPEPPAEPAGCTNHLIAYHDRLIKEWFEGELARVEDLYPNRPAKAKRQDRVPPLVIVLGLIWTLSWIAAIFVF